jgi:DNA-binding CsgD family transcriptional regulator
VLAARTDRGTEVAAFAVDLAQRATGQVPRPAAAGLVEPFSTQEQVVLRYLPSTLSNAEIAAELYVSVNTVKSHQRTLDRKLAAEGRREVDSGRPAGVSTGGFPRVASRTRRARFRATGAPQAPSWVVLFLIPRPATGSGSLFPGICSAWCVSSPG